MKYTLFDKLQALKRSNRYRQDYQSYQKKDNSKNQWAVGL